MSSPVIGSAFVRVLAACTLAACTLAACMLAGCATTEGVDREATDSSADDDGSARFPTDWIGAWRGECFLLPLGDEARRIPMELVVERRGALDGPPRYAWRIAYEGESAPRAYELIPVDASVGHYAIDESMAAGLPAGQGVVLDSYLLGGVLYSAFDVDGSRLLARYELEPNGAAIRVEIVTAGSEPERVATTDPNPRRDGAIRIAPHPVRVVQRARLLRVDDL